MSQVWASKWLGEATDLLSLCTDLAATAHCILEFSSRNVAEVVVNGRLPRAACVLYATLLTPFWLSLIEDEEQDRRETEVSQAARKKAAVQMQQDVGWLMAPVGQINAQRLAAPLLKLAARRTRVMLARLLVRRAALWLPMSETTRSVDERFDEMFEFKMEVKNCCSRAVAGDVNFAIDSAEEPQGRDEAPGLKSFYRDMYRAGVMTLIASWKAMDAIEASKLGYLEEAFHPAGLYYGTDVDFTTRIRMRASKETTVEGEGTEEAASSSAASLRFRPTVAEEQDLAALRDVFGGKFGEGFLLLALRHFSGSLQEAIGRLLDEALPTKLAAADRNLTLDAAIAQLQAEAATQTSSRKIVPALKTATADRAAAEELKRHTLRLVAVQGEFAVSSKSMYNDEYDDTLDAYLQVRTRVDGASESEGEVEKGEEGGDGEVAEDDEEEEESEQPQKWGPDRLRGGRIARGRGGVRGRTVQAMRKERKKAGVANHHRRDRRMAKERRGMLGGW